MPSAEADKIKHLNKCNRMLPNGTPDDEKMHSSESHLEKKIVLSHFSVILRSQPHI